MGDNMSDNKPLNQDDKETPVPVEPPVLTGSTMPALTDEQLRFAVSDDVPFGQGTGVEQRDSHDESDNTVGDTGRLFSSGSNDTKADDVSSASEDSDGSTSESDSDNDGGDKSTDSADSADADNADADDTQSDETEAEDHETEAQRKQRRHVKIMRGIVTPILALLAVVAFVLGILNATIWKPDPRVSVAADKVSSRYLLTDPGVLALADNETDIVAKGASDAQVCIAVASSRDAIGWLSGQEYTRVTGLASWQQFTQRQATATSDSGNTVDSSDSHVPFADSDMWQKVTCGQGSAKLVWNQNGGDRVLLVDYQANATDDNADTNAVGEFSMIWVRAKVLDLATPCFFVGGLLVALAVMTASLFAWEEHRRHKKQDEEAINAAAAAAAEAAAQEPPRWMHAGSKPPAPKHEGHGGRRRRRRHGKRGKSVNAQTNENEQKASEGPEILDATSTNLLAQNTPAVSTNDLQEYFARLAAENTQQEATENGDDAASQESTSGNTVKFEIDDLPPLTPSYVPAHASTNDDASTQKEDVEEETDPTGRSASNQQTEQREQEAQ